MGNAQPRSEVNGIITVPIRTSSNFRIENMPQWVPFIRGGYRIDQRIWDELYGHVMSCESYESIDKLRTRHVCNLVVMVIACITWFAGICMIMGAGMDMLIEEEETDWWDTTSTSNNPDTWTNDYDPTEDTVIMIMGAVLMVISVLVGVLTMQNDRKNRKLWVNHVRTQLAIKLRYLNAKYDRKLYFMLDQWNVRITIEVKVSNVVFVPDSPQYYAPIGGTGSNENQGLVVNQVPMNDGGDQGFIDVQMPDGNIVKCKIVSQAVGGVGNYGSAAANDMNQPLVNASGEGNENEAITMK